MSRSPCIKCGVGAAAKKRGGLCWDCFQKARPPVIDGTTILRQRLALRLTVADAAAAIGVDPKHWVDDVEDNLELDAEYASTIIAAMEALHDERLEHQERAPATPEQTKAPPLAAELI